MRIPAVGRGGRRAAGASHGERGDESADLGLQRCEWPDVPPGDYKVRLSANGKGDTQALMLTMDPRLVANHVTAADLAAQYAHNIKMREMVTETNRVAGRIRTARTTAREGERRESQGGPRSRRDDVRRGRGHSLRAARVCRRRSGISPVRRRGSISASGRMRSIVRRCCGRSSRARGAGEQGARHPAIASF